MICDQIKDIMKSIVDEELNAEVSSLLKAEYNDQRLLINSIFRSGTYSQGAIILRLVVIDSLYSTNASYSYFSFEEMAERIYNIPCESDTPEARAKTANDYFYHIALTGQDERGLFSERYGIQKDLREGSQQMSLLSKYAYYCLLQDKEHYPLGFPIYDRLAKEAYPVVCKMLGVKHYSMPSMETPDIHTYITAINHLRTLVYGDNTARFYGYQQFDILDAYLWRLGKFEGGNLSLLLGRDDYMTFIKNIGLDYETTKAIVDSEKFNAMVLEHLLTNNRVFAGTSDEVYLTKFLNHWKLYHENSIGKRERGIKIPKEIFPEASAKESSLQDRVNETPKPGKSKVEITVEPILPTQQRHKVRINQINNSLSNHSMEIKIDGRLLVSTLCERFKEEFGGTLRVYKGNKRCDGSEKVTDVATSTGSFECRSSKTVGGFKNDLQEQFGIKIQIASADDWVLALDEMTLSKLPEIPKQATRADMEVLKSKYAK